MDKMIGFTPILINFVVTLISVLATYEISKYTINTNRKLNEENAKINAENVGKNRVIYETEKIVVPPDTTLLKEKLATGNYTILNSFSDRSVWSNTIVILGKIKP